MLTDPWFYAAAVPALLIVGIGKGGFGGGLGALGVPVLALVIPPTQAAAILLPVLAIMDIVGLYKYRGTWDRRQMAILAPGAVAGIVLGSLTFAITSEDFVRLIIGGIAVGFTLWHWGNGWLGIAARQQRHSQIRGSFWSSVSGYTSFVAHAGGPPLNVYLLPQRLDKTVYVGTTVVFFALVNYVKLIPYALLGQFDTTNLAASAVLSPLAPVGVLLGVALHHRISDVSLYRVVYVVLMLSGLKLLWDGSAIFR
ncbi:MAG: sulfite exporter TauE/SafE family protein [Chloroflexi bacterium]|nr:sulfite exporter TauE/SafE family protein [Chloroflexota bacterium]